MYLHLMSMYLIVNFLLMFLKWGKLKYKYLVINYLVFVVIGIFKQIYFTLNTNIFNVKTVI